VLSFRTLALATLLAWLAAPAVARDLGTFSFTLDNDLFGGSDRYYTNGVRLAWRSPAYAPPGWIAGVGRFGAPLLPPAGERRWGLALGQSLYTPEDLSRADPDPDDQPYAAWLYGAFNLSSATAASLSRLEVQLGVIGPAALGEQAQNTVHRINRGREAQGWDAQLGTSPASTSSRAGSGASTTRSPGATAAGRSARCRASRPASATSIPTPPSASCSASAVVSMPISARRAFALR